MPAQHLSQNEPMTKPLERMTQPKMSPEAAPGEQDIYRALIQQEQLRLNHLHKLTERMRFHQRRHETTDAITWAEKLLAVDPFREHIHRELMLLYMKNGEHGRALHQYELCQQTLQNELGIEPLWETKAVYEQIRESMSSHLIAGYG